MSAHEPVVIEFQLTPEDWVEVSMEHAEKSPQVQEATRNVRILMGALIILAALITLLDGATTGAMIWLLAGAIVMAVMTPTLRSGRRRQVKKYAESGIANGMFGSHRVELRPEGMVDRTSGYERLTYWSAIDRVEEGEGSFLVYTGTHTILPIPHTAFPDAASLRRFSEAFFSLREADRVRRLTGTPPEGIVPGPKPREG